MYTRKAIITIILASIITCSSQLIGQDASNEHYVTIKRQYKQTNVPALMRFESADEVDVRREKLKDFIFDKKDVLTNAYPQYIKDNIHDADYDDIAHLFKKITLLDYTTDHDVNSVMYYFKAKNPSGKLRLTNHDWLSLLDKPFKYFMEPIAAGLNYATIEKKYNNVSMVGLSGGGWSVTLFAAIDERADNIYQVGGTMPMFLRSPTEDGYKGHLGDWESHSNTLLKQIRRITGIY